jgi:phenylpropionate dioxygenase-like ring-hydroxylating dioxygenase large terminal subunit
MTLAPSTAINYDGLIQPDRVHARLYYDPAIFEEEMEKIWYREWVFVGHDSEVPNPGDMQEKRIGLRQVYLVRGADGQVTVAQDSDGASPIARVAAHRGFVFGSFSPTGKSLDEHLQHAKEMIDKFADLSPTGELDVRAGVHKVRYGANWKMQLENSVDNYHALFVHESAFMTETQRRAAIAISGSQSHGLTRDLGGGHTQLDFWPQERHTGHMRPPQDLFPAVSAESQREFAEAVERRLGKEYGQQVLFDSPPHIMVFPNLFIINHDLRIIQPVGVKESIIYQYVVLLKGAPQDINVLRLRRHEYAYGPAGKILPDDMDIFERNQIALEARGNEWVNLNRGLHRERRDDGGLSVGHPTDELPQRAIWRHYKSLMTRE